MLFEVRAVATIMVQAPDREAAIEFVRQSIEDEQWTMDDADIEISDGEGEGE